MSKSFARSQDQKRRLFVDPASISSGWALFKGGELVDHGSIVVDQKLAPFDRLKLIYFGYVALFQRLGPVDEVHIEQLPRRCHIYTHYSVCAAGIAFANGGCLVAGDIPVQSWQKSVDWNGERAPLETYQGRVSTEDELAAIGMGLWYIGG